MRRVWILLGSGALAGAGAPAADVPPAPAAKSALCFRPEEFQSWKAPNATTIYIRVFRHRYFRLDLAARCPELLQSDSHLITRFDGTNRVCEALDWNIRVSEPPGVEETCIVKAMTALTAAEAAAIPKDSRP